MGRKYMVLGFDLLLGNLKLLKPDIGQNSRNQELLTTVLFGVHLED